VHKGVRAALSSDPKLRNFVYPQERNLEITSSPFALRVSFATSSSSGGVGLSLAFAKYASPATERESTSSEERLWV